MTKVGSSLGWWGAAGGGGASAKTAFVLGSGYQGALGNGVLARMSSPVQLGAASQWISMSFGDYTGGGVKSDGTLWTWGRNTSGALGLGDTGVNRSSPTQVGTGTNWAAVSLGATNWGMALKTDGTLWTWGQNGLGQSGDGSVVPRSSPAQVGTGTNWAKISASSTMAAAIRTDGTLWAWGNYSFGRLGLGVMDGHRSSPSQVGTGTNWASVFPGNATMAITTGGTLFMWGRNQNGQLGQGDVVFRSSPTQVGTGTNWSATGTAGIGGSNTQTPAAIKTDGTLWVWGDNGFGTNGQNDVGVNRSSPTQVGTGTNWSVVGVGYRTVMAVKTNGTLWAWGDAANGELGQGADYTRKSSPVQIGTGTGWTSVVPPNATTPEFSGLK